MTEATVQHGLAWPRLSMICWSCVTICWYADLVWRWSCCKVWFCWTNAWWQ